MQMGFQTIAEEQWSSEHHHQHVSSQALVNLARLLVPILQISPLAKLWCPKPGVKINVGLLQAPLAPCLVPSPCAQHVAPATASPAEQNAHGAGSTVLVQVSAHPARKALCAALPKGTKDEQGVIHVPKKQWTSCCRNTLHNMGEQSSRPSGAKRGFGDNRKFHRGGHT